MAYVGQSPDAHFSATAVKDSFDGDGSTTSFTLTNGGSTNTVDVFVENVRQEPTEAYSVDGTTLTFTEAPPTGTGNIYVVNKSPVRLQAAHPSGLALEAHSATISTDLKVDTIKNTSGTTAATIDSSGRVVQSNVPAFRAYSDAGWSSLGANNTWVTLALNQTLFDNGSHYDTTNYKYVVPVTGIYNITGCAYQDQTGKGRLALYVGSTEKIFTNVDYDGSGTTMHIAGLEKLTAGDELYLKMRIPTSDSNDYFGSSQHTWLAAHLVSA